MTTLKRSSSILAFTLVACAAACTPPVPPSFEPANTGAKKTAGKNKPADDVVVTAPASASTREALGITKWHTTFQKSSGAVILDGSDGRGEVKFTTALRHDSTKGTYHIESHTPRGVFVLDLKQKKLVKNSLPEAAWLKYASAYALDVQDYEPSTEFGRFGEWAATAGTIKDVAGTVKDNANAVALVGQVPCAICEGIGGAAAWTAQQAERVETAAGYVEKGLNILDKTFPNFGKQDPSAQGKETKDGEKESHELEAESEEKDPKSEKKDPNSEEQDPNSEEQDPNSEQQDPNTQPDPNDEQQDPNAQQDPSGEPQDPNNEQQDPNAQQDPSAGGGDDGAGGGDQGGGGGDDGAGGGDQGGGGGDGEQAAGSCRKKQCSKSTGVCFCTHY